MLALSDSWAGNPVNYVAIPLTEIEGSVEHLTDECRAGLLTCDRGYQVLHPLRHRRGQGAKPSLRQRMERRSRAARAAQQHARQPWAARSAGTELRPGLRGHPDPALGAIALRNPLADFLPFIEGPPLSTPGPKTWGFFWRRHPPPPPARAAGAIDAPLLPCDNPRPPAQGTGSLPRRIQCARGLWPLWVPRSRACQAAVTTPCSNRTRASRRPGPRW